MAAYLPDFVDQAAIFTVEYNRLPDFERIMSFKEDVFKNRQVPYVRFYRDGKLVRHSNWLPRGSFSDMLGARSRRTPWLSLGRASTRA